MAPMRVWGCETFGNCCSLKLRLKELPLVVARIGGAAVQQRKYRLQQALKQLAFWFNARQNAYAQQDTQKGFGKILSRMCLRDASILLAITNASKEEFFYLIKKNGDDIKEFVV